MRVLIGPLAELRTQTLALAVAERLAGPDGAVISLRRAGVPNLSRLLSEAEVETLREAVRGSPFGERAATGGERELMVGYVAAGSLLRERVDELEPDPTVLVAVTDHADLTWRSPLTGPNDEEVGPRFPSVGGVYSPETVKSGWAGAGKGSSLRIAGEGMIVVPGIVAGVQDDRCLSDHEAHMAAILGCTGVSSELAPVAVVAAHLGSRLAAVVLTLRDGRETPGGES
jgi:Phosphorylase superfamily